MDKLLPKVFAQAEALWRPEAGAMRQAFDLRRAAIDREAAAKGGFGSGNRVIAQANAAAAELEVRGAKILKCLLDAHKVAANVRSKTYSLDTFCAWYNARIDEEATETRRNPPLISGHADAVQHYVDAVSGAVQLAKDRAHARIAQHFGTETEWWAWHYAKKLALLKSVPTAWWVALVGWALAIVAIFDDSLAVTLRSMLPK